MIFRLSFWDARNLINGSSYFETFFPASETDDNGLLCKEISLPESKFKPGTSMVLKVNTYIEHNFTRFLFSLSHILAILTAAELVLLKFPLFSILT